MEFTTASTSGSHSYPSCETWRWRVDTRGRRAGTRARVSRCPGPGSVRSPHRDRVSARVSVRPAARVPCPTRRALGPGVSELSREAQVQTSHSLPDSRPRVGASAMTRGSTSTRRWRLTYRTAFVATLVSVIAACAGTAPNAGSEVTPSGRSTQEFPSASGTDRLYEPPRIHGVAMDEAGSPLNARVAVVVRDGSNSSTQVGPFSLPVPRSGPATLIATTEDGHITWRAIGADDRGTHTLVVNRPGAFLELELDLDEPARVAVF
jgi:hypothetical protein